MDRSTLSQIIIPVIILIMFVIGIYGVVKMRNNFTTPPSLGVNVEDNSTTTNDSLLLTGSTEAKELTINGNKVSLDKDGNYSYELPLAVGSNKITFNATANGKSTTMERTVTREAAIAKAPATTEGNLSSSGPEDIVGVAGLVGVMLASFAYYNSRKNKSGYKLFTKC